MWLHASSPLSSRDLRTLARPMRLRRALILNNDSDRPLFRAAALRLCLPRRDKQADALW
jgi:hypothetical protein